MKTWRIPLLLLFVVGTLAAVDWSFSVPRLPDRVPIHFGPDGKVDALADRAEFVRDSLLLMLLAPLGLLAIGAVSAGSVRVLPAALINLPRKDYWLATPERRSEAAAVVFGLFLWILLVLFTIGAAVTHAIFVAANDPAASPMGLVAGVIVGGLILLLVRVVMMMLQLAYPPQPAEIPVE
jgi:uncharacterized membrane protein